MTRVYTDSVLTAEVAHRNGLIADTCDLLWRLYGDPTYVVQIEYMVVDVPLLCVTRALLDADGQVAVRHHEPASCPEPDFSRSGKPACCCIATESCDVLLTEPLPEWWQPSSGVSLAS